MKRVLLLGSALCLVGTAAFAEAAGTPASVPSSSQTLVAQNESDDSGPGDDNGDYSAAPESDWADGPRGDWHNGPPHHWRGGDGPDGWRGDDGPRWQGRGPGMRGGPMARMMQSKGAHIVLQHRGNRIDVKCADDDSTADCVAAVERLMDKIATTIKLDRPHGPPPPPPASPAPPTDQDDSPAGPAE